MATDINTTTRRAAFSAVGFTGLALIATLGWSCPDVTESHTLDKPADNPDAPLIALCTQFDDLERDIIRSHKEDGEDEEAAAYRRKLSDRQRDLLGQIVAIRSTTMEGARARAKMLHLWHAELEDEGSHDGDYWNDRMIWALVRDLAGAA